MYRSIPASAGQPQHVRGSARCSWVYPRECGAARSCQCRQHWRHGLSPRVRGSLPDNRRAAKQVGSIPASAGQPCRRGAHMDIHTVYPRECGAAHVMPPIVGTGTGLSPRVRGSPDQLLRMEVRPGSIPASAGQPLVGVQNACQSLVYPRECGAAVEPRPFRPKDTGLSPRVRGSHHGDKPGRMRQGSIPASAGQPINARPACGDTTVYPRECGAAPRSITWE